MTDPRWTIDQDQVPVWSDPNGEFGVRLYRRIGYLDMEDRAIAHDALVAVVHDAARVPELEAERDALLAMVEQCRELVPTFHGKVQEDLAYIVGWPAPVSDILGPVRSCCGQRHMSPECPDGLVRCCLCFDRFPLEDLHQLDDGTREDVCEPCFQQDIRAATPTPDDTHTETGK